MKTKLSISFLTGKSLQKKQVHDFKNGALSEKKTHERAKVINLYQKDMPETKQAKVISIFS